MATAKLPDKLYGGYYILYHRILLNVIKAGTSNFNSKLLCCIDLENISQAEDIIYEICVVTRNGSTEHQSIRQREILINDDIIDHASLQRRKSANYCGLLYE